MEITSTPFIRNDYWPEYDDINQLNQRIDEAENEISLVNIRLSTDIENVSNNLNSYAKDQADTSISNNIIVNNLNANYVEGRFANFDNTFTNNAYIENLTVNKPVFDITLNTPHLENTTSLGGNFYEPKIIGGEFDNILFQNIQNFKAVNIETESFKANTADLNTLNVNVQATIKDLNAVNIEADDVKANTADLNVLNAVNIETESFKANIADLNVLNVASIEANEVKANKITGTIGNSTITDSTLTNATIDGNGVLGDVEINNTVINTASIGNLFVNKSIPPIFSSAILGYDANGKVIPVKAAYDVAFPENASYLFTDEHGTAFAGVAETAIGESSNLITAFAVANEIANVTNDVDNKFNNIGNLFNDVNNNFVNADSNFANISDLFNNADNNFNDISNSFNDINSFVNNGFNDINSFVNNGFNDINNYINNSINNVNVDIASLLNIINTLIPASFSNANKYTLGKLGFSNVQRIEFVTPADTTGTNISTGSSSPVYLKFDATTNTLKYTSNALVINETMFRAFNANMGSAFIDCTQFNQSIYIPDSVTDMTATFRGCSSLDQNIRIPNTVTGLGLAATFWDCSSLNQNILIPNGITNTFYTFFNCFSLNQNIKLPSSVTVISHIFEECNALNQNIQLPNGLCLIDSAFTGCTNLNQNILIPSGVTNMESTFSRCVNLNQNILIPNTAKNLFATFWGCSSLNQNILIPPSATRISQIFWGCTNMNQDVYIYSQNINAGEDGGMKYAFRNAKIGNIHLPTSVPKDTTNHMYNCLVNGNTGIRFSPSHIFNDLPVDIEQWPPV